MSTSTTYNALEFKDFLQAPALFPIRPLGRATELPQPGDNSAADGRYHIKTYNRKRIIHRLQRPDTTFKGTFNMSTIGLASYEPRELNAPWKAADYAEMFEIPVSELRPEEYHTYLSVDLTEPGGRPIIDQGAEILREATYKDAIPWILVSLSEKCVQ